MRAWFGRGGFESLAVDEAGGEAASKGGIADEELKSPDPSAVADVTLQILLSGTIMWTTSFLTLALGFLLSECQSGAPLWIYSLPCLAIANALWTQHSITSSMEQFEHSQDYVACIFKEAFAACRPRSLIGPAVLDHYLALMVFGALDAGDLATDGLQVGQVQQCDSSDADFHRQFYESWQSLPWMLGLVDVTHLWGLFALLFAGVVLVQGLVGARAAWSAWRIVKLQRYQARPFPQNIGYWNKDVCWTAVLDINTTDASFAHDKMEFYETLATAAEWAYMAYCARLYRELAAGIAAQHENISHKITEVEEQWQMDDDMKAASKQARFAIAFRSIIRVVLLENAPALWLTCSFFCLQFDSMSRLGKVKVLLSSALSAGSAISKAAQATQGGIKGILVAAAILAFVLVVALKYAMAFTCPSHFFSMLTFQCVADVRHHSVA